MRYYIYFDSYRRPRKAIAGEELAQKYNNNPDEFLRAMCGLGPDAKAEHSTGHVGILRFDNEKELKDYLETTGEEIAGFYECREDCRPYNF